VLGGVVLASDVSDGVFGLLGVAFGGVVSWLIQREALHARQASERRRIELEADIAWKLVGFELSNALDTIAEARRGEWPIGANRNWATAWTEVRGALLRAPPNREGLPIVAAACAKLDELQSAVNAPRSTEERTLKQSDHDFLGRIEPILQEAFDVVSSTER